MKFPPLVKYRYWICREKLFVFFTRKHPTSIALSLLRCWFQGYRALYDQGYFEGGSLDMTWNKNIGLKLDLKKAIDGGLKVCDEQIALYESDPSNYDIRANPIREWTYTVFWLFDRHESERVTIHPMQDYEQIMNLAGHEFDRQELRFCHNLNVILYYNFCLENDLSW